MQVGILGTGAIAKKHAQAYKHIGYEIVACTSRNPVSGRQFAEQIGSEFVCTVEELCSYPRIDFVDVCTLPDFRMQPVELCAQAGKHVLVEKPIATDLKTAKQMIVTARKAGIQLGVVSQHRFDDASLFLAGAIAERRLGKILQADAYVKWYRPPEYYSRPVKGSWSGEGGGALINQGIHQIDLLLWLAGPVEEVFGYRQLGALHRIEGEDVINAVLRYSSGATGVIQASTAFWPGSPERIDIHGTNGTAIMTGDHISAWQVKDDCGEPAPVNSNINSGAADPLAISTLPFERQLLDFGQACRAGRAPLVSGIEAFRALQLVTSIYKSCAEGRRIEVAQEN